MLDMSPNNWPSKNKWKKKYFCTCHVLRLDKMDDVDFFQD